MVWRIEELELYCEQLEVEMDKGRLSYEQAWSKVRNAIHTKYQADVLGTFPGGHATQELGSEDKSEKGQALGSGYRPNFRM